MEDRTHSFGYWLRRRRKALDLTQEALARKVSCSAFTIRKIEADERRPSRHLADRLAAALAIPKEEQRAFLDAARALRGTDGLPLAAAPLGITASSVVLESALDGEPRPPPESTPFVGRDDEFDLLVGLIARLTTGEGQTILIEGEPGIGKSRLMREVTRFARSQGLPTLTTNCYEIDRAMPYQPVIDLIVRALDQAPLAAFQKIAPVSLAELAALVPAVADRFADLPHLSRDFPEARQARLSRAVGELLEATGDGRPLIIAVDDIQWADDASAQVLHYLARHVANRPALLIYAYRDEDLDSDERLARFVESLCRESDARRISLERLEIGDAEDLVAALGDARLAAPGLGARLHRETEGNPFFLVSILQSLTEGGIPLETHQSSDPVILPHALRAAVRSRISRVPQDIRSTLETAAVLGRRFDFDTLLEATREPEGQLLHALEWLVKRRLLREEVEGGIYDFSHDKVREVVYHDIGGARRRLLHRSVAEVLEFRDDVGEHERDALLAEHYERAHVWSKALKYFVLAGECSLALFAIRDALHCLDRAIALSELHPKSMDERERLALYERRGAARAQAGHTEGAVADIRRVIDAAHTGGERKKARDALIQLGMIYRRADAYSEATTCLASALAESRTVNDAHSAADTLYHLGTVAWSTGQYGRALEYHQEALEICERVGLGGLVAVQAYHGRGEAHIASAEPAAAIRCLSRSIELTRGIGDKSYEAENLMMIGYACMGIRGLGDYPRALSNFNESLKIARAADLQWHIGPILLGLDHVRACTGDYGTAWSGMMKTLSWIENLKVVRYQYQFLANDLIGHLLLDLGLTERALQSTERALALSRDTGIDFCRDSIEAHRAIALSRLGDKNAAQILQGALEHARRTSARHMMVRCLDGLAEVALAQGDVISCRNFADELLAISVSNGLRELEAIARRWRGEAWLAEKAYAQAQPELSRAGILAGNIGRVRLQLDLEAGLARLCTAQGLRDAAQDHGAKAHSLAEAIEKSLVSSELEARLRPI